MYKIFYYLQTIVSIFFWKYKKSLMENPLQVSFLAPRAKHTFSADGRSSPNELKVYLQFSIEMLKIMKKGSLNITY